MAGLKNTEIPCGSKGFGIFHWNYFYEAAFSRKEENVFLRESGI